MANSITLAFYSIRVTQARGEEFQNVSQYDEACDLNEDFLAFITNFSRVPSLDTENQKRLKIGRSEVNGRITFGIVETGEYGYESNLVNVDNEQITHTRQINEAEMLPFFFSIIVPRNANEALVCLQRLGQRGIKTVFSTAFQNFFIERHPNFRIQFNEIIPDIILDNLINHGIIKKIHLVKFGIPDNIEDVFDQQQREIGINTELVLSAGRRGRLNLIPRFVDVVQHQRMTTNFIEVQGFNYDNVKLDFELFGKKRIVDLSDLENLSAYYDISREVQIGHNGHPVYDSIKNIASERLSELMRAIGIEGTDVL